MKLLFTDGAVSSGRTCGAAVLLDFCTKDNTVEILDHSIKINENSTNNEAEFFGILKALELVDDNDECFIYSDSEYCINSLTKWIKVWYKTFSYKRDSVIITPKMVSKSGKEVKNCKLIIYIINKIVNRNIKVHFMHVRGHMNPNNKSDLDTQAGYFSKANNIALEIAKKQAKFICKFNNYIDNFAKTILKNYMNGEYDSDINEINELLKLTNDDSTIYIDINRSDKFQDKLYSIYLINNKIMEEYFKLVK